MAEAHPIADRPAREAIKHIAEVVRLKEPFDALADALVDAFYTTGHAVEATMVRRFIDAERSQYEADMDAEVEQYKEAAYMADDAAETMRCRVDDLESQISDLEDELQEVRHERDDLQEALKEAQARPK